MAAMISQLPFRSFMTWLSAVALACGLAGLSGCAQQVLLPPVAQVEPPVVTPEPPPEALKIPAEVDSPRFARIALVANQEIGAGHTPGAVILVGNQGRVVYKKGFGLRTSSPYPQAMTTDTIFDLASMTKVVATTTAVMQLVDAGRLRLDDPAAKYWPEFAGNGKGGITIRQLMMHTSGLRADVNSHVHWSGYEGAMAAIACDRPINPPGTTFHYSDANF
ncbi:MAG: serine hydrolase, partial [Deltaproteobacteria bacterium]|nr:serine hydrolase [Deltaproteobacteria bacterium]